MIFNNINRKLQIVLAGAATSVDCPVVITAVDFTATTYTSVPSLSTTSGTTPVDILSAPAAATQRKLNNLNLLNIDTGPIVATITYYDNGTPYKIITATLQVGETLTYSDIDGWAVHDSTGALRTLSSTFWGAISGTITNQNDLINYINAIPNDITIHGLNIGEGAGNQQNTVFGLLALISNTTGVNNVAIGPGALRYNTTGQDNIAIGTQPLTQNISGIGNIAIGDNSLTMCTDGADNIAIGRQAAVALASGTANNIAIGTIALTANVTGVGNIAIGVGAGGAEMGSNTLYIDGTGSLTTTPLIKGTFDPAGTSLGTLTINGTLQATRGVVPRLNTITSSTTPTPVSDTTDIFTITALAAAATFGVPTYTDFAPVEGQGLIIRIIDNASPQVLAWNAVYRPVGVTLPLTTVASKYLYVAMLYNAIGTTWDVVAVIQEI